MFQTKDVQGKGSKFLKVFQGFLGDPGIFVQKRLFCAHIDVNRKKKKKKKHSKRVKENQPPSLVPRPVRAIRVARGGLEPGAIAQGVLGEFSRQA